MEAIGPKPPHKWVWRIANKEFRLSESEPATEFADGADGSHNTIGYYALRIRGLKLLPGLTYQLELADRANRPKNREVRLLATCGGTGLLYKFEGFDSVKGQNLFWEVYHSL